ncbi:MAG: hypothetical protein HPY85_04795 [Anaerolineae bacterium]|nr:hypothetical protein [Anaerolineae bacterium]
MIGDDGHTELQPGLAGTTGRFSWIVACAVIVFVAIVLNRAWMCDDAYITLRVVDHWVSGYGLRWNIAERVQVFTHPLWMLLISILYVFTREAYLTVLLLSLLISCATVLVIISAFGTKPWAVALGILLLGYSSAFVDYSTSGLENPLSHLLMAIFLSLYFRDQDALRHGKVMWVSLIAGLMGLNRLDTLLISLPMVFLVAWRERGNKKVAWQLLVGGMPVLFWLIFSIIHYGFLLPNTYYAKTGSFLTTAQLLGQGVRYVAHTVRNDPITAIVILIGIAKAVVSKNKFRIVAMISTVAYLVYVISVGGDFMGGRFFSILLLIAVVQIIHFDLQALKKPIMPWLLLLLTAINFMSSVPTFFADNWEYVETWKDGIVNERHFYYSETGLLRNNKWNTVPTFPWVEEGKQYREMAEKSGGELLFVTRESVGFAGYYAGPNVYIVDILGLGTALTAQVPPYYDPNWRIGHLKRIVPEGYSDAIINQDATLFSEGGYREVAEDILMVTTGKPFSRTWWVAVWNVNTSIRLDQETLNQFVYPELVTGQLTSRTDDEGNTNFGQYEKVRASISGVRYEFASEVMIRHIEVSLANLCQGVVLLEDSQGRVVHRLPFSLAEDQGSVRLQIEEAGGLPVKVRSVHILPVSYRGGRGKYFFAYNFTAWD